MTEQEVQVGQVWRYTGPVTRSYTVQVVTVERALCTVRNVAGQEHDMPTDLLTANFRLITSPDREQS
jgi:hypothetical protein